VRGCRDIDLAAAHHGAMTAIAWTLVGLMAASLGVLSTALFTMFGRFDAMDAKFANRFDAMDAKFANRFDAMDAKFANRFDAMDATFTSRFDAVNARLDNVNERIDNLGAEIRGDLRVFDERLRHVGG
jgi:hypothetical protein